MTKHIIVKPGRDEIRHSLVAFWERDAAHKEADPAWADDLFIAGDAAHPDKTYIVSETPGILAAIRAGRLEKVGDAPGEPVVIHGNKAVLTWPALGVEVDGLGAEAEAARKAFEALSQANGEANSEAEPAADTPPEDETQAEAAEAGQAEPPAPPDTAQTPTTVKGNFPHKGSKRG